MRVIAGIMQQPMNMRYFMKLSKHFFAFRSKVTHLVIVATQHVLRSASFGDTAKDAGFCSTTASLELLGSFRED